MKKGLLFCVFVQLVWGVVAQNKGNRSANLEDNFVHTLADHIEQTLEKMKLPYKGYDCHYEIRYSPQDSSYVFYPKDASLDTVVLDSINSLLSSYLWESAHDLMFGGQLRFDELTNHVFVAMKALDKDSSNNRVFSGSVFGRPEPRKGMREFYNRWIAYLSEKKSSGLFSLDSLVSSENFVVFKIGRDGTLSNLDNTSSYHQLVTEFLAVEEKWSPAIYRGRTLSTKVAFKMPTPHDWENYHTNIDRNLRMDFYADRHEQDNVFMRMHYIGPLQRVNLVSMVWYKGKYVAPVIHKGDIQQSKALIEFLQANEELPDDPHARFRYFYREYFYTEIK